MFYILEIGNINVAGINIEDEIGLIDFHLSDGRGYLMLRKTDERFTTAIDYLFERETPFRVQRTEWMEKGRIKEPFEDVTDKIVKEYQSKYAGS
ncbi:hypothetical protein AB3N02_00045 [Priestia aryabhattai]|jgi:hypothetical protein|uniref:hypothetical protein n=1 Tax=Priestia TaxID=2800373 RepID=UPI00203EF1ED|nr:hypothetical protein [Priestia aryabhattai]MCM3771219.1 hypothetical protein [Priestia aryabhattai]